jgi:uncharacterized protein (DUF608 family)
MVVNKKKITIGILAGMVIILFLWVIPFLDQHADDNPWVDVSHSRGIPLGGLGNGYSMFGKYGFIKVNFNGRPDHVKYGYETPESIWGYTVKPEDIDFASFGFTLSDGVQEYVLQEVSASWKPTAIPFDEVKAYAFLPKARFEMSSNKVGANIIVEAFTPLIRYDLNASSTPIQVFDVTIENTGFRKKSFSFNLENSRQGIVKENKAVFVDKDGALAFGADNGIATENGINVCFDIKGKSTQTVRFYIAWYYPNVKHVSDDKRFYTETYNDVSEVIDAGMKAGDSWLESIDNWHNSVDVPVYLKRLWFSSLSSVITSTMLGQGPSFYEIETPHYYLNTMDVSCYSSWVYLVNWPELEMIDMDQYASIIETEGDMAGYVWHSMIKDKANYVEEPCYLTRMYRDYLWFNNNNWLSKQYPFAKLAANRVYKTDGYKSLINSEKGNQSYDIWKMPGISAYVNITWVYGLHSLYQMARIMDDSAYVDGISTNTLFQEAKNSLDSLLWNPDPGYWNCFFRTPTASEKGEPTTIFSDQLFGKWMLAIDRNALGVLPEVKVKQTLQTIYMHNLIEDKDKNFRGWANGLKPGRLIDTTGYHAHMFWFGAQFNLASLLSLSGDEEASLDVMKSVEASLNNNHLAAGEWNQSFDENLNILTLPKEPAKDTPRFPAYPRYKSGWEYLVRMIGLQMDEHNFYLQPFKTLDFSFTNIELAGTQFSITVQKDWTKVLVDGKSVDNLPVLPRIIKKYTIDFVK